MQYFIALLKRFIDGLVGRLPLFISGGYRYSEEIGGAEHNKRYVQRDMDDLNTLNFIPHKDLVHIATKRYEGAYGGVVKWYAADVVSLSASLNGQEDPAMLNNKNNINKKEVNSLGGIDLTSANINLQTKVIDSRLRGNDSEGIKFHIDFAMLQQLQNAPGFMPVIISVEPLKSLSEFLGLNKGVNTVI